MSTSGETKFEKYFKNKIIATVLTGYNKKYDGIPMCIGRSIVHILQDNCPIVVLSESKYKSKYPVYVKIEVTDIFTQEVTTELVYGKISGSYIAKPLSSGSKVEVLKINPQKLIAGVEVITLLYDGKQSPVVKFDSAKVLSDTIIKNLQINSNISDELLVTLVDYFNGDNPNDIKWGSNIEQKERNELGTHLGELLYVYISLKNKTPYKGKGIITSVYIPTDKSFPGIDSIFETDLGLYGVSHKYGIGACPAFFKNILSSYMKANIIGDDSVMSKFADIVNDLDCGYSIFESRTRNNLNHKILYEYGIRYCLNISKDILPDTFGVYEDIRKTLPKEMPATYDEAQIDLNLLSKDTLYLIEVIKNHSLTTNKINDILPYSITKFLSTIVSHAIMNDKFAMGHIYDVIDDKGNVQVNLNMSSFKHGIIDYMVTDEKDLKLAFSYPTSIAKPEAGHGLLNYYLTT